MECFLDSGYFWLNAFSYYLMTAPA